MESSKWPTYGQVLPFTELSREAGVQRADAQNLTLEDTMKRLSVGLAVILTLPFQTLRSVAAFL
jgi:hypothetical protein